MTAYVRRVGIKRAVVTLAILGLMFDTIWDGKAGEGCKSALQSDSAVVSIH